MNLLIAAVLSILLAGASHAANDALVDTLFEGPYTDLSYGDYSTMSQRVRVCRRVADVGTDADYVLQCLKRPELTEIAEREDGERLFFAAGDIIAAAASDDRYVFVNVVSDAGKTCYRIIREIDEARDGYYAVEVCERNEN
ncbi:MAG: hypothetical protein LBJ73_00745 [Rickettsiales bacterium]|jgi:hypothetical protein|nr:hypothetical protein [Rickettsiales bacterium]